MKRIAILIIAFLLMPHGLLVADEVDLRSEMSPVKHQGQRGTCSVLAATALMEQLIYKKTGKMMDLSESYAYWLGKYKALDSDYEKQAYQNMDGLAGYLALRAFTIGCMLELEWPYELKNWAQLHDPRCKCENDEHDTTCYTGTLPERAKTLPYKISQIFIKPGEIAEFLLKEKKPVTYNLLWIDQAVDYTTGDFRMPKEGEMKSAAGHVILLVGYSRKTKRFIFRNSWGPLWGNKGYGTLPENYVLEYGEMRMFEPLSRHPPEVRKFLEKAKLGSSGTLVEKNNDD